MTIDPNGLRRRFCSHEKAGGWDDFAVKNLWGSGLQGATISQNELELSTSVIRGATPKPAASLSKVVASTLVAQKPSLQTMTPFPVAW